MYTKVKSSFSGDRLLKRYTNNLLFATGIAFLLVITGCGSNDFTEAPAALIADVFKAGSCEITVSTENANLLMVELTDPQVPDGYATEKVQSTAALILFRNLSEELLNKYNQFVIGVSRSGKIESAAYSAEQLRRADQAVHNATALLDWNTANGIADVALVVDNEFITDSMLLKVKDALMELDSTQGKAQKKLITGFRADRFRDTGEDVTVVWGETQRLSSVDDFTFYVRASNGKIVYMSVD
jgi:hypothetical protein